VPPSGSLALTVVTAVVVSLTEIAAEDPPPFETITGASLTLATVKAIVCVSLRPPESVTRTTIS
jgi:hypothetical protein